MEKADHYANSRDRRALETSGFRAPDTMMHVQGPTKYAKLLVHDIVIGDCLHVQRGVPLHGHYRDQGGRAIEVGSETGWTGQGLDHGGLDDDSADLVAAVPVLLVYVRVHNLYRGSRQANHMTQDVP